MSIDEKVQREIIIDAVKNGKDHATDMHFLFSDKGIDGVDYRSVLDTLIKEGVIKVNDTNAPYTYSLTFLYRLKSYFAR